MQFLCRQFYFRFWFVFWCWTCALFKFSIIQKIIVKVHFFKFVSGHCLNINLAECSWWIYWREECLLSDGCRLSWLRNCEKIKILKKLPQNPMESMVYENFKYPPLGWRHQMFEVKLSIRCQETPPIFKSRSPI